MARIESAKKKAANPKKQHAESASKHQEKGEKPKEPVSQSRRGKESGKAKAAEKGKSAARNGPVNSLSEAIKALGGDDEDLELLKDVDSDAEPTTSSSTKRDVSFQFRLLCSCVTQQVYQILRLLLRKT